MTWKKAQNLKAEVSSSKIDEMAEIEKLWRKREIDRFPKIERFALSKICHRPSTKLLLFRPGWSDFAETGLYGFVITNGEKSRSTNAPNSLEFEELRNFRALQITRFVHFQATRKIFTYERTNRYTELTDTQTYS